MDALRLDYTIFSWQKRFAYLEALGFLPQYSWPETIQPFLVQLVASDPEPIVRLKAQELLKY